MVINLGTLLGILIFYAMIRHLCASMLAEINRMAKEDEDANLKLCHTWTRKEKPR